MYLGGVMPQKLQQCCELTKDAQGEALVLSRSAETLKAVHVSGNSGTGHLMELVVSRENMKRALERVRKNKGSPGVDGMSVAELLPHCVDVWPVIREQLLSGAYRPQPVKRVEIPKDGGGVRELGIPTVIDRLIQQSILQVLQPLIDPTFSEHSYGFRPGRSAHDAVKAAQSLVQKGKRYVVDMDLEKFFDRVNHDILMDRLAKRILDKRLLRVIRSYLEAGVMHNGVVMGRDEGTPQGGPLSPLLANVLLDEVDKHLESRGYEFVRYADDCNVYVSSRKAGERVMVWLRRLYAGLHLRVNNEKSAVDRAANRKILGFSMWSGPKGKICLRVAGKALDKMKSRVRAITRRNRGVSIAKVSEDLRRYLTGWKNYFKLADTGRTFDDIDKWIRHRVRALHLKHWKRGKKMYAELTKRGCPPDIAAEVASQSKRWWKNSAKKLNSALPNSYFDLLGIPRLGR